MSGPEDHRREMEERREPGRGSREGWLRAGALGFLLFFLLAAAVTTLGPGRRLLHRDRQPIAFNHQIHVEKQGLPCDTCHEYYARETFSGLPGAAVCSTCHSEPQGESEEERKLVTLLQGGAPLDWTPLFRQPSHVFYSHRRHVAVAGIDCAICHGAIGESEGMPAAVKPLRMEDCVGCHEKEGASTECTACHR